MRRINPSAFRIARRGISSEINRQIALNLVRSKQPISRAELARLMGVRRGAISRLVSDLLDLGLVVEGAKGDSKRGRRPRHLHIDTRRRCVLAVDIGPSRTWMMVADAMGHPLLGVAEFATRESPQAQVKELARRVDLLSAAHPEFRDCKGMGVVIAGLVDLGGRLRYAPVLGWRDVDLLHPLRAATRLPVVVENSVKACALAQVWAVPGDVPVDGAVAFVDASDGVGVGIAIDGKLLRGANNIAGEFGHVSLSLQGPRCSCGQVGCWEAYASNRATVARYLGRDGSWPSSAERQDLTVEAVIARARGGEARAREALEQTGHFLGQGLATIVRAIDPRRIYVGGEITAAWDLVEPRVRAALRQQALVRDAGETPIFPVSLGEHPRLRGAAALVNAPTFAAPIVA